MIRGMTALVRMASVMAMAVNTIRFVIALLMIEPTIFDYVWYGMSSSSPHYKYVFFFIQMVVLMVRVWVCVCSGTPCPN